MQAKGIFQPPPFFLTTFYSLKETQMLRLILDHLCLNFFPTQLICGLLCHIPIYLSYQLITLQNTSGMMEELEHLVAFWSLSAPYNTSQKNNKA